MAAVILLVFVYAVLAACVLCAVLLGRKLGLYGALLRIAIILASCVISFVVVKLLSPILIGSGVTLISSLGLPRDLVSTLSNGEGARTLLGVLTGGILSPFLFALLSIVLIVIGTIIAHFAARKLPKGHVGAGMGIGALQGLLIALVILFPLISLEGLIDTATENSTVIKNRLSKSLGEETVEGLELASDANVMYLLFGENLVKWTVNGMTATSFDGGKTDVYATVNDICSVVEASKGMSGNGRFDLFSISEEQYHHMEDVLESIKGSPFLSFALSDIVSAFASAIAEGESFMGMSSPENGADTVLSSVYRQMFRSLADSDRESVIPNLSMTFRVVSKWNSSADGEDRMDAIREILGVLEGSEEMSEVAKEIKLSGMRTMMQEEIPVLKDEEKYDATISGVLGLLDENEPTVENVAAGIDEVFSEHDYELSDEQLADAAEGLVEKRNELGRPLTEEELADLYFSKKEKQE